MRSFLTTISVALVVALAQAALTSSTIAAATTEYSTQASWKEEVWATINVCQTSAHPDVIGIRGAMPGLTKPSTLYMRFRAQYSPGEEGAWRFVRRGSSRWMRVGTGLGTFASGWNLRFRPPPDDSVYALRGRVDFQWRRGVRVLRRASRVTTSGHGHTVGADPSGYSVGVCYAR